MREYLFWLLVLVTFAWMLVHGMRGESELGYGDMMMDLGLLGGWLLLRCGRREA